MPLTLRLSLTYLLVTLAGALLLGLGLVAMVERYLDAERARALSAQAAIYAALLAEIAPDGSTLGAVAGAGLADDLLPPGTAARVFGTGGGLLAGDQALGPFPSRAALALLSPAFPLPASQVSGRTYAAAAVAGSGGPIGVVELSRPAGGDASLIAALRRLTLQAALAAALAVGLLSLLLARSIARPVLALARRAERLAAETVGAPAAPATRGRDELRQLAGSLDRLEAGLRAYVARIDELEQARARFFRSVSHELRTPLTAIRGNLENLADAAPAEQRPAFATLEAEAERLSRLVDELLRPPADGRLLLAERRPVDLAALAAELAALLEGRARRAGVALAVDAAPACVAGDRDRLKQAMLNLLDNALRHAPPGGRVSLRVEAAGGEARVSVADDGPGVPAELAERIWERGVRGPGAGAAGLGLAIVREIVAAHGGHVVLDPGHRPGARFVIALPLLGP